MENIILYSVIIALFAVSYRLVMAHTEIFSWWFQFGLRFHGKWFYQPIWGCELCFAGQVAAWTYGLNWLSLNFNEKAPFWRSIYFFIPKYQFNGFSALTWAIFIFITIIFTSVIAKVYQKIKDL